MPPVRRIRGVALAIALVGAGCGGSDGSPSSGNGAAARSPGSAITLPSPVGGAQLAVTEVATGLDTVWALAWAPDKTLHWSERPGRVTKQGQVPERIAGVAESGEAGLMGLAIDGRGRRFVMYTGERDNRIVRIEANGRQTILVDEIIPGAVHDGGRIVFGPDGRLYASTGDAGNTSNVRKRESRNGKVLRVDPESGAFEVWSTGHRNIQGLCFAGDRLLSTEHGPDRGDELNVIPEGFDGGWPEKVGNGIANWTPTIAPAGCTWYDRDLIPQWKGSMLFVTLKDASLRRLVLSADFTRVERQEQLYAGQFGRLRDVSVGPDGAVYLATSNRDGRGNPRPGDDKILRIAPSGE